MQLSCVLFLSLYLCGLQTHVSPSAFDRLPHIVLYSQQWHWGVWPHGDTVTAWCSKGAQGSPPGRCPAHCPPGYTDLVFVDLENVGGSCKPSPIAPQEPFSPHPCWYGTAPTLGPVSPPFSSVPAFLILALHFPLAAGLQREVSQLATTCARHHHPPQARDTGAFTPRQGSHIAMGRVPGGPWHCCLATGAGVLHNQCCGVLFPPPDCTS